MLSSLTSYLWGGEQPETTTPPDTPPVSARDSSPAGSDDWVLVGPSPRQLGLGSLGRASGRASRDVSRPEEDLSVDATVEPVQDTMDTTEDLLEEDNTTNQAAVRVREPATVTQSLGAPPAKLLKSAQLTRQRTSGKALSSKSLKRSNKAVMAQGTRKSIPRNNFPMKMAGANKNLKQC